MAKTLLEPITPAIMELPIWRELRKYVIPNKNTNKPRGHFNLRQLPSKLLAQALGTFVKCGAPECNDRMCIIRKHAGSNCYSIHVTGLQNGHPRCKYGRIIQAQILALQLDIGQAEQAPRVRAAREDQRQGRFKIKVTKDGPELSL